MISDDLSALAYTPFTLAAAPATPRNITIPVGVVTTLLSLVCWAIFIRGIVNLVEMIKLGQPDHTRCLLYTSPSPRD